MFEPFFSERRGGSELGLAVSRGIVEAHGGQIVVDPTVREGARLIVELRASGFEDADGGTAFAERHGADRDCDSVARALDRAAPRETDHRRVIVASARTVIASVWPS